jgi:hypothetical protein
MAGNLTSEVSVISNQTQVSYGFVWSGSSPVGTIAIQGSNDFKLLANGQPDSANPGTWNSLPLSSAGNLVTTIAVSGNSGMGLVDIDATGFYAIRAIYTFASGTGSLTATFVGKVA